MNHHNPNNSPNGCRWPKTACVCRLGKEVTACAKAVFRATWRWADEGLNGDELAVLTTKWRDAVDAFYGLTLREGARIVINDENAYTITKVEVDANGFLGRIELSRKESIDVWANELEAHGAYRKKL